MASNFFVRNCHRRASTKRSSPIQIFPAILYRAIFDHAQFNEKNDFSNADLRSASFRDVEINGNLNFTDTAWWLALGWTLPQIEKFAAQYSDLKIRETKMFNNDVIRARREVDNATSAEDRVRALNALAWNYAIYGADLKIAEGYSQNALEEFAKIKTIKGKSDTWIVNNDANFTDTKAYILLQEDRRPEAVESYEQPGIIEPSSQGDYIFKYAVALHALAMTKEGDEKKRLDQKAQLHLERSLKNRNYIPSHELYLLRRYITDEFRAKLIAYLSNDAN
jgi:Pentapeptide repeats (9 copies)